MRIYKDGIYRDMSVEELEQMKTARRESEISKVTRPLTDSEILRIDMRKRVNSLGIDNQTAGRMMDCFPTRGEYCGEGELIPAGTRVRDDGDGSVIWRANVDLWNTEENSPENAPALWDRVAYHDGVRIIPDVIPAMLAWKMGELGWRSGRVYRSDMDGNVYLPESEHAPWTLIMESVEE